MSAGVRLTLLGHGIFVRTAVTPGREPLLLIHGYPSSSFDWHHVWDALASRYSVYALDLLGFGLSDKPRGSRYPIALQADLCEALLARFDVHAPHVLAHDYGVTVAQELLARQAEGRFDVASVCFLNGGLFPETHRARPVQRLLGHRFAGPILARCIRYRSFARTMRTLWGTHPPAERELRDLWALQLHGDGRQALPRVTSYMQQRRDQRGRWVGALLTTRVPCRLVCGLDDPVSGRHLVEHYRAVVPRAEVAELPGVGHYLQLEAPQAVLQAYQDFRDSVARRPGGRPSALAS